MLIGTHNTPGANTADLIKDSGLKTFMTDVIEASRQVPVLVDFWAPWCGPCKQLTPVLEKLVKQAKGKVRLVKVNVDENQQIAAQLQVKSVPAVFAFVNGQPIDAFMGALPESQIKQFIDRLSSKGSMAEQIAAALQMVEETMARGEHEAALGVLSQILGADPENMTALALAIRCQIALGDLAGAAETLASVPADKQNHADIVSAKAALELAANPVDMSELQNLQADVAKAPDDFDKRLALAIALNGAGQRLEAADELLYIFKKQRGWNDDAARKQLLQFFDAWGPKDEATLAGRRKLSSLLFA